MMIKKTEFFLCTNSSTIQPGGLLLSKSFLKSQLIHMYDLSKDNVIYPPTSSYCICNFSKHQRIMRWCGPVCGAITGLFQLPSAFWGSRKTLLGSLGMGDSLCHLQSNLEFGIPLCFSIISKSLAQSMSWILKVVYSKRPHRSLILFLQAKTKKWHSSPFSISVFALLFC